MRIVVFGDSVAYGAWDSEAGWVERIKREAHGLTVQSQGATKLQVINLGIGGDTSTKILKRMKAEIEARHSTAWPFVFIFAFGTNDERQADNIPETSIEQFETNVQEIITIAKVYTDKILFLGIPPIAQPTVFLKGQEYSDERIQAYDKRLQNIVEANDLSFLSLRPAFEAANIDSLYSYDLLHPNDKGHELIASQVQLHLQKLLKP